MIVVVAVVVAEVVVVIVVVVGTNNGIGFFTKFEVSANVGKIRVMLNRERTSGRQLITIWVIKGKTIVVGSHMANIGRRNGTFNVVIFNTARRFGG
jgi:hypothetical protein